MIQDVQKELLKPSDKIHLKNLAGVQERAGNIIEGARVRWKPPLKVNNQSFSIRRFDLCETVTNRKIYTCCQVRCHNLLAYCVCFLFLQFDGTKGFFNYMASAGLYDFSYPRDEKCVVPSSKWPNYNLSWGFCHGITSLNHNESFLVILVSSEENPIRKIRNPWKGFWYRKVFIFQPV